MNKAELIAFEEDIKVHFLNAEIRAPVHFSAGNEDALIKIFKEIRETDWVFSTHRNHLHALLHGIPKEWIKSEILAGRSMHLNNQEYKFMTSAIVGGCLPIAVGVAMALKIKGSSDKVFVLVGDMAASVGTFHDCAQYAARNNLPITFIVEDNGLSTNTPTQEAWGSSDSQPSIISYKYKRGCPHINAGVWVIFK